MLAPVLEEDVLGDGVEQRVERGVAVRRRLERRTELFRVGPVKVGQEQAASLVTNEAHDVPAQQLQRRQADRSRPVVSRNLEDDFIDLDD